MLFLFVLWKQRPGGASCLAGSVRLFRAYDMNEAWETLRELCGDIVHVRVSVGEIM